MYISRTQVFTEMNFNIPYDDSRPEEEHCVIKDKWWWSVMEDLGKPWWTDRINSYHNFEIDNESVRGWNGKRYMRWERRQELIENILRRKRVNEEFYDRLANEYFVLPSEDFTEDYEEYQNEPEIVKESIIL